MTKQSPVAAPPPADDSDDDDYGKSILGELRKLNGRLDQWGDLLTQETNTETSSDPETPVSQEMPTRASSETPPPAPNSPTSENTSSEARADDSSSETPTVDPNPVPNRAKEAQSQAARKSLGFLGKKKSRPNP